MVSSKGQVYQTCVYSEMLRGSESWPVKVADMHCMVRNDMKQV